MSRVDVAEAQSCCAHVTPSLIRLFVSRKTIAIIGSVPVQCHIVLLRMRRWNCGKFVICCWIFAICACKICYSAHRMLPNILLRWKSAFYTKFWTLETR